MISGTVRPFRWMLAGVLLVPVPILAFEVMRRAGLATGVCEDLVTVLVMVPLGGPHVVATFTRTFLDPRFRKRDPIWLGLSAILWLFVLGVSAASIFTPLRFLGVVPIQWVLTGFFFWASIHILQQSLFGVQWSGGAIRDAVDGPRMELLEKVIVWSCLYPVAMLRMSMTDASGLAANHHSLGAKLVTFFSESEAWTSDYVFRIGRVVPILPSFIRSDLVWMAPTAVFFTAFAVYLYNARKWVRSVPATRMRTAYITTTAVTGFMIPLAPNLDTAFQGLNAWHCFQYIIMVHSMNCADRSGGRPLHSMVHRFAQPGKGLSAYLQLFCLSSALVFVLFSVAYGLTVACPGRFKLFEAVAPADGSPEGFRPGGVLSAYYLLGFGALLVHYLQDTLLIFPRGIDGGNAGRIEGAQVQC